MLIKFINAIAIKQIKKSNKRKRLTEDKCPKRLALGEVWRYRAVERGTFSSACCRSLPAISLFPQQRTETPLELTQSPAISCLCHQSSVNPRRLCYLLVSRISRSGNSDCVFGETGDFGSMSNGTLGCDNSLEPFPTQLSSRGFGHAEGRWLI